MRSYFISCGNEVSGFYLLSYILLSSFLIERVASQEKTLVKDMMVKGFTLQEYSDHKRINYRVDGSPEVLEELQVKVRMYGNFPENTTVYFRLTQFVECDNRMNDQPAIPVNVDKSFRFGSVDVKLPSADVSDLTICLRNGSNSFVRQYSPLRPWLMIHLYKHFLPPWLQIILIICLLLFSGLFSGLTLGLMSLNKTELKVILNTGTPKERINAARIVPVRNHGNFLLCGLLISNVLVNSTLTILLDDMTSGLVAVILSTIAIVVFGEIIPQAICSRHGLVVGGRTIEVTKFFMFITFPVAYPLSKLLDKFLGEEIGSVYTRERLKELLRITRNYHGLDKEEVGIITGALDMKSKTVKHVMTPVDQMFMLSSEAVLNFDTMAEIEYKGHSRIPVYEDKRSKIVGVLNVKQLVLLDVSDRLPLKTIIKYYNNPLFFVLEDTRLDFMFRAFREGNRGHMAFVQAVSESSSAETNNEVIGVVTMEDVLEELLQAEIMDETDFEKLHPRERSGSYLVNKFGTAPYLFQKKTKPIVEIPGSLAMAAVQFLSTNVEPFQTKYLSETIIQRLLRTTVMFTRVASIHNKSFHHPIIPANPYLYESGVEAEYFIMILEGRAQVQVGKEKLTFEAGPFTIFGAEFLLMESCVSEIESSWDANTPPAPGGTVTSSNSGTGNKKMTFVPDYTVKIMSDMYYMRIKHAVYKAARRATELERSQSSRGLLKDDFDFEKGFDDE